MIVNEKWWSQKILSLIEIKMIKSKNFNTYGKNKAKNINNKDKNRIEKI